MIYSKSKKEGKNPQFNFQVKISVLNVMEKSTAVLGYRESERWIRICIFYQDVLGYLVFIKLYQDIRQDVVGYKVKIETCIWI